MSEKIKKQRAFASKRDKLKSIGFEISRLGFTHPKTDHRIELEDVYFSDSKMFRKILLDAQLSILKQ